MFGRIDLFRILFGLKWSLECPIKEDCPLCFDYIGFKFNSKPSLSLSQSDNIDDVRINNKSKSPLIHSDCIRINHQCSHEYALQRFCYLIDSIVIKAVENNLDIDTVFDQVKDSCGFVDRTIQQNSDLSCKSSTSPVTTLLPCSKNRNFSHVFVLSSLAILVSVIIFFYSHLFISESYRSAVLSTFAMLVDSSAVSTRRCLVPNNYLVKEITRPPANCDNLCGQVKSFHLFHNDSFDKEQFSRLIEEGQPTVVRGAVSHWTALDLFSFEFFRDIYLNVPNAYSGVDEECQFFPFRTEFNHLSQVFAMSQVNVKQNSSQATPWYIGWSNCNPEVAKILRQYYDRPWFLPEDSEHSIIDWIFMGYTEIGASMHLDYVHRPSWQAQISGSKTWHLLPPPECEHVCQQLSVTVHKGDIILLDTNQWYHDTHIHPGQMSITIGSEYD